MASTAAVQSACTGGSLLSMGKQRALAPLEWETPLASTSAPETIAAQLNVLLAAARVVGSGALGVALEE